MCLIINDKNFPKVKKAEKNIKCIKVAVKKEDSENPGHFLYCPVFYPESEVTYNIGTEITENIEKLKNDRTQFKTVFIVNKGLHTFNFNVNGWKRLAVWIEKKGWKLLSRYDNKKLEAAVLECVIPEGSEYYEGQGNCMICDKEEAGSYVSNRLLPVREIPKSEWENYMDPFLKFRLDTGIYSSSLKN